MINKIIQQFFFALIIISSMNTYAIKATPDPFTVIQPNGDVLKVRLHGDEFFRYMTTGDGYLISQTDDKYYKYAVLNTEGKIETTSVIASDSEKRTLTEKSFVGTLQKSDNILKIAHEQTISKVTAYNQDVIRKSYPLTGSPKTLIILVNFSDKSFTVSGPKDAFTNLLNQEGYSTNGGTGCAKDYFKDASNGAFSPQFDVVGPYTLPNNMAYYGENSSNDDKNPRQMVIDACNLANQNGVDFTQYDTDNDGIVDNIFIYYAGYNEAEGGPANSIWPHRWTLANYQTKFDGKVIFDYACTSELRGNSGTNMCGIGTFCHEFGHVLGLADYYDTASESHYTISYWNIMDEGAYLNYGRTPPTYSAYDRFYLGWMTPVELKTPQNVTLNPLNTSNKAYLISRYGNHNLNGKNPSPVEFFMLENRQKTGWDTYLPGHGLLITRIYYSSSTWTANTVNNDAAAMGFDIMEADGNASSTSRSGDPFPGASAVTSYDPVLRAGTIINKPLTIIKETGDIISFRFMGGGDVPLLSQVSDLNLFNTVQGTPSASQTIKISGKKLTSNININLSSDSNFEIKKITDSATAWVKSITLLATDSVVDTTAIYIRYNPSVPSFQDTHTDFLVVSASGAESLQVAVNGKSTRPVYVVPPVALDATGITYVNFVANWHKAYDATGYYLTVYSLTNGSSEFSQGFENGLVPPTGWTINATTINTSSVYSGIASPSVILQATDQYIETEKYCLNPNGIKFFIRSIAERSGAIRVEGFNGTKWMKIDSLAVTDQLNGNKVYDFGNTNIYQKFRLKFVRSTGQVSIDDVTAVYNSRMDFIFQNKWIQDTTMIIPNVVSDRDYYYLLKASDKTLNTDSTIKYENITDYSNTIYVKTAVDTNEKVLRVVPQISHNSDGSVTVIVSDTEPPIYIYTVLGQLVRIVYPETNIVKINNLPVNQVYVFSSGKRKAKVIL